MSSIPPIITPPPPPNPPERKAGGKVRRWLNTRTGKGAVAFIAAGTGVLTSPEIGSAVTAAAEDLSKGQTAGVTALAVAAVLGFLRSRSA